MDKSVTQFSMLYFVLWFKHQGLMVPWILLLQALYVAIIVPGIQLRRKNPGPETAIILVEPGNAVRTLKL